MPKLRIGLVGCGFHADAHVAGLLGTRETIDVTAVCDIDQGRAEQRASELDTPNVFTDYEQMLATANIDAVLLCLPHLIHAPATIAAARAGKHVLVEKPIATTLEDADAMITSAEAADVTFMVAHNQRFLPAHQRIKQLLDDGSIGSVECARADHNQDFRPPEGHWILDASAAGGGAFIGYGVHRIDLLRWYVGEVAEIAHFQRGRNERFGGESTSVTILKFESGAIGEITINWVVRDPPWMDMIYLYGEKGSIHNIGGLHVVGESGSTQVETPVRDPFTLQLEHFAESVMNRTEPLTNGRDARRTLEVCLAGYRSAETGRVIRLG